MAEERMIKAITVFASIAMFKESSCARERSKIEREMRMRCAIFVLMFAGLCGWAQQSPSNPPPSLDSPSSQDSSQQSNQEKQKTNTKQQDAKPAPGEANPFPEDISRKAADAANSTSPDGKSAEPDYSSSHVDLKKFDEPAGSESRISNGAGGFIHDPQLAARDDKIAKFYLQNGDFKGAYDRYKEASEVAPEDGEAVFGLAESARGLHRPQEAATNYQIYLDAFPDGKKSKEARKALAGLTAPQKK
jgi:tetratricopeptide (TPR) repeat protein